jgi:hypothetical protein
VVCRATINFFRRASRLLRSKAPTASLGAIVGALDGTALGSLDGAPDLATKGASDGVSEGNSDRALVGTKNVDG